MNDIMYFMETKNDKIDMLSKIIDGLYKKLVILVAISGGFGAYSIKFLQEDNLLGFLFVIPFSLAAYAVLLTYVKLNESVKEMKRIYDE